MNPLGGVLTAAAFVLLGSGAAKWSRPLPTRQALFALGLPSGRIVVFAVAIGELAVGATALVVPGALPAFAVTAAYLGFAGFVVLSMVKGGEGCGCFGAASSTPPGVIHLVVNLGFAGAASAAAGGDQSIVDLLVKDPGAGAATAIGALAVAGLATAMLTVLPSTRAAASTLRSHMKSSHSTTA
jgi:hypothetical protein